jgi:hypothetical protein
MSLKEVLGAIAIIEKFHSPHANPTNFINNKRQSHAN